MDERRIAARFAGFDQDGNGYIDREDFYTAAKALLAEFDVPARCDQGQDLFAGAEAFWQGMAGIADVDGDQRVTRGEFVTGAVKRLRDNPDRFAEIARPFLRAAIAVAERDSGAGTGIGARVLRVLGVDPQLAPVAFESLDTDKDGRISEDEAVRGFAHYFTVPE
ncbi:EF-hand domain-containing protein [Streptomyces sp. VRA16 Mangrove soil]|uniref:EF-hand domain-containing protein n=1 Tax=Streptomyces sp. VRA16 Mangrove soil TaxID=2817434 RepID=UPI001A9E58B7|nr:EF-hand domain-containing protein [Streptomyces sp. VRA16 Mangrove soil]MBO1337654.1 EF-hand domain-containing protein [Streptomyces sp. VRA16 Mangrove soil]